MDMSLEEFDQLLRKLEREDIPQEDRRFLLLKNAKRLPLDVFKQLLRVIYPEYEPEPEPSWFNRMWRKDK